MYIYNVTIKPEWSIHDAWLQWMKEEHIPEMLATKDFYKYQLVKLVEVDEADGPTYAIQYYAHTRDAYLKFVKESAALFSVKSRNKWGDRCIQFATLMQVVH